MATDPRPSGARPRPARTRSDATPMEARLHAAYNRIALLEAQNSNLRSEFAKLQTILEDITNAGNRLEATAETFMEKYAHARAELAELRIDRDKWKDIALNPSADFMSFSETIGGAGAGGVDRPEPSLQGSEAKAPGPAAIAAA
jgi:hypothetical protein